MNWLSASGTACLFAGILSALVLRMSCAKFARVFHAHAAAAGAGRIHHGDRARPRLPDELFRRDGTLGLAFAATGASFPFFSALLGWLGVFLTGSDTSANALFGNLQVVTATGWV